MNANVNTPAQPLEGFCLAAAVATFASIAAFLASSFMV
jgi:hypothetical protein